MGAHAVRFVSDGASRHLVLTAGMSSTAVLRRVRDAFQTGHAIQLYQNGELLVGPWKTTGDVVVEILAVPSIIKQSLVAINGTRLGPVIQVSPEMALEPRILEAFASKLGSQRSVVTLAIDLDVGTVDVVVRSVESMLNTEKSTDPAFDRPAVKMLEAFDATRVVPVLILTINPYMGCLFLNSLPWAKDAKTCCDECGNMVCVCGI